MRHDDGISLLLVGSLVSILVAVILIFRVVTQGNEGETHRLYKLKIEVGVEYGTRLD